MAPPKLKKTRTMQNTAKDGESYLKRSWGEKKFNVIQGVEAKPKLEKHTTILATTKESEALLGGLEKIDTDAKTRNQDKAIKRLTKAPSVRKPAKLTKNRTMLTTAKESEVLLKDADIDQDAKTRNQAESIKKLTSKKTPEVKPSAVKKPRAPKKKKPAAKKPSLKKTGTMVRTAKEGKAFVKRLNKKSS